MDPTGVIPLLDHVFYKLHDNQWDLEGKVQVHIFQSRLDMQDRFSTDFFSCTIKFAKV